MPSEDGLNIEKEINGRISDLFERAYHHAQSLHPSDLVGDIMGLWEALTISRQEGLSRYFKSPAFRRAYLGYYLPLYVAKIALLIKQLAREGHMARGNGPYDVLDLGSGPLVGILAAQLVWGKLHHATAVDREIGPMRAGQDFLNRFLQPGDVERIFLRRANLSGPSTHWRPERPVDLIIISHVLNEFGYSKRSIEEKLNVITSAMRFLKPNGRMIIVEPANRVSTRHLMMLRDEIFKNSSLDILAPCTGASRCPLLKAPTNWCHGELSWTRPEICRVVDEKIGFDKDFLKYSYLLLRRGEHKKPTLPSERWRVVSGVMRHQGVLRRYVCTRSGLLTLSQLEKEKSRPLATWYRGELIDPAELPSSFVKVTREN